jgi:hypothetical protein
MAGSRVIQFSTHLCVPDWARWVACDATGSIWAFETKPTAGRSWWEKSEGRNLMVAEANWWYVDTATVDGDLYSAWRETLREVVAP